MFVMSVNDLFEVANPLGGKIATTMEAHGCESDFRIAVVVFRMDATRFITIAGEKKRTNI